jgi:hypothetical protein
MEFSRGIATGFAAAMVVVQSWLAIELGDYAALYADLGDVTLSLATRITISHAWLYGVPFAGTALIALLVIRRPARLWPYLAAAAVLVAAVAATYYFPRAPLFELAGNIKPS